MPAKNANEKLSWLFQQYGIVAIKDKPATAFLTLRWTFPAKRACVAADTEPDRLAAVFSDEGSQLKQARRRSPVTPPGPRTGPVLPRHRCCSRSSSCGRYRSHRDLPRTRNRPWRHSRSASRQCTRRARADDQALWNGEPMQFNLSFASFINFARTERKRLLA